MKRPLVPSPAPVVRLASVILASFMAASPVQSLQLGPKLILEDSVVLRETGEHYIGEPTGLLLSDDGSFFVADRFSNRILRFGPDGQVQGVFGQAGQGPGEFAYIGTAGFVANGVLGFLDLRPFSVELFDVETGRHRGAVGIAQGTLPMSFSVRNDTLWVGGVDTDEWRAVGMASVQDVIAESATISLDRIRVPRPYVDNQMILGSLGYTTMDVGAQDLLVGFGVSPFILRTGRQGAVFDTLVLPAVRRRGLPDEGELAAIGPGDLNVPELVGSLSTLWAVSRDEADNVYALHQDFEFGEARVGGGFAAQAEFFVSSVDADGSGGCPDTLVPTSDVGVAKAALKGSRMYLLDQRLVGVDGAPRTVIRRFRMDPMDCTGTVDPPAAVR